MKLAPRVGFGVRNGGRRWERTTRDGGGLDRATSALGIGAVPRMVPPGGDDVDGMEPAPEADDAASSDEGSSDEESSDDGQRARRHMFCSQMYLLGNRDQQLLSNEIPNSTGPASGPGAGEADRAAAGGARRARVGLRRGRRCHSRPPSPSTHRDSLCQAARDPAE
jgi:hypothetical protein